MRVDLPVEVCIAATGGYIFHHPLPRMVPLLLRKEARGGGVAATSWCFASNEARRWLSDRPRHPFGSLLLQLGRNPTLAGRGGSVSRRDHNQAYRRPPPLSGGTNHAEKYPPNASRSSGEGVWGRGASLREAASPPESPPHVPLFEREREGGGFLQRSLLPRNHHHFFKEFLLC